MVDQELDINNISLFVFDFDGVMTDNKVHVDASGNESVICSREDGLAIDVLKKLDKKCLILSSEKNHVVKARGKKLGIEVVQGASNKELVLDKIVVSGNFDYENICYFGNDLNDYNAMLNCKVRVCPADSHSEILKIATNKLSSIGGDGVIREFLEKHLNLDFVKILYTV